jgi:hypothetical protein
VTDESDKQVIRRSALHAILLSWHEDSGMRVGLLMCVIGEIMAFETEPQGGHTYATVLKDMFDKLLQHVNESKANLEEMKAKAREAVAKHLDRIKPHG